MPATIQHLVVLMMENRSFDHMLGFLKSPTYAIEGLIGTESNPSADGGTPVQVSQDALSSGDLNPDPGHDFVNVNIQIFGNSQGQPGAGPLMEGFVRDYSLVSGSTAHGAKIMKCFNEQSLPVLSTLAKQYAICDQWFSSIPGPTIPNRMFTHGATSLGSVVQDPVCFNLRTIFEIMDNDPNNENDYRIYHHGFGTMLLTVGHLIHDQHGFREYGNFVSDCASGNLPAYTFIEPRFSDDTQGALLPENDQHPNADVAEGERLIKEVYDAIRDNEELWKSTLLLIVYDEHGGIFDHVAPPTIPAPWVEPSISPPFNFDRLGVRVPAVLVSAYIAPGTIISRQFEHSSIVATVRKLFVPNAQPLTVRDATAATFEDIPQLNQPPRTDRPIFPVPQAASATAFARTVAAAAPRVERKPTELMMTMVGQMEQTLKMLGLQTTQKVETIYTAQDATNYLREAGELIKTRGRHAN
jgi:phospholipase C